MGRQFPSESLSLSEGCKVEISFKSNGTEGVWYKAIIEAKPPTNHPYSGVFKQLCVRLLKDNFSTPLNNLLIRPIPPKNVLAHVDIEIGTFVEADYKDAWWTGFVVKKLDDDKCLVFFDSLSDIIKFDRQHLRPHLQWLDEKIYSWWIIGSTRNSEFLRRLAEEPMFSPGTVVELSSKINEDEVVWVPAMVIKEFKENDEYKYIVKDKPLIGRSFRARPNKTVDLCSLRPIPPYIRVEEYRLEEYVEVYHDGIGWRQARVMETQARGMGTDSQKWCVLLLEAAKKQLCFKKSDVRPQKVWEDGVWKTRESSLTQVSGDKTGDSVMNANESDPPVTSPPGITTTPFKQIEAETQRKTFPKKTLPRNQDGSGKDSTRENENSEDINRKRKREDNLCSVASVEKNKAKDTTMVLPFEKTLPIWKTLESMEVFKTVPQSPHFSPLLEIREDSREMMAVGMMFTFSCSLEQVKVLQHDETISSFISLSNSLCELEKHGFNVEVAQSRIYKLLTLKGRKSKEMDELEGAKKVTAEKKSLKVENERKILELQRLNEEMDKEIAQSMSYEAKIVQQIDDVKLEFQATALAPWPTPPCISVDEYQSEDYVEVFHDGMGWRQGRVTGTLSQKWYTVRLEATDKEMAFKHSDLRPLRVWEDGVWKTRESTLSEVSGDDSVMNANESDPPSTLPPSITTPPDINNTTQLKQIEALFHRKTFPKETLPRNQSGSGNDSTRENENRKNINRKRKREEKLSSVASVEEDKAKDTTMVLPFEKKLPIWKTLESMEVFKTVPQSPHFSPLVETSEDTREMSAVGMMLTFSGLLEEVKALQPDHPVSSLLSLNDSFSKLEKHGFNVKAPQLRISNLLSLIERQSKKREELKGADKVTTEKESVKAENERKILELQRLNEDTDKEIAQSKSCAAKIVQQLDDVKFEFQATASAPW